MYYTAKQIATLLDGEIIGDENTQVDSFSKIENGNPGSLSFLGNPKYEKFIYTSRASIIITSRSFVLKEKVASTLILVKDAYESFNILLKWYDSVNRKDKSGIDSLCFIHETAKLGNNVYVGAFSYLSENVSLGNGVKIYPNCYIGEDVIIDDNTIIHPGTSIFYDTKIGKNCVVFSNCSIGADGFGFSKNKDGVYEKVPQIGNVVIEDYVEIGANSAIDRATIGSTIIKFGCKIDNLVQVGHNVMIGANTVIASQTGIAGSSKVGSNVILGGQVGVAGHITIGNSVIAQAKTGVGKNITDNERVFGSPAMNHMDFKKSFIYFRRFPEIVERLNRLEKLINQSDKSDNGNKTEDT